MLRVTEGRSGEERGKDIPMQRQGHKLFSKSIYTKVDTPFEPLRPKRLSYYDPLFADPGPS